MAGDEMKIPT
jgi:hypothetical protein